MSSVTSREFQKNVGQYQDLALRRAVTVTKHGREHVVILAAEEYRRLKELDRRVLLAEELSDDILDAIEKSEMPPGHQHLDAELDG